MVSSWWANRKQTSTKNQKCHVADRSLVKMPMRRFSATTDGLINGFLSNISDKNYSNLKNFYDRVATISLIILYLRSKLNHSHVYKKKSKSLISI